jgi:type II restriction/modification system DNA methylase subunit YeeA
MADFSTAMREALLDACALDWSAISPAIFGSLFQSIMDEKARRNLGAHYTSEANILKLIKPLFLDELHAEFERVKGNRNQLLAKLWLRDSGESQFNKQSDIYNYRNQLISFVNDFERFKNGLIGKNV